MKWLDNIPMSVLLPVALLLGLAPFVPEPHLWEKLKMLANGELIRPIDIFGQSDFIGYLGGHPDGSGDPDTRLAVVGGRNNSGVEVGGVGG